MIPIQAVGTLRKNRNYDAIPDPGRLPQIVTIQILRPVIAWCHDFVAKIVCHFRIFPEGRVSTINQSFP